MTESNAAHVLESRFGWDILQTRGLWAFGPTAASSTFSSSTFSGTCALLEETLLDEGSNEWSALQSSRSALVQGFQWACREGPLVQEGLRGVSYRLVGAQLSGQPFQRGSGQLFPAMRRALYSATLCASPRLMEPVLRMEVRNPDSLCFVLTSNFCLFRFSALLDCLLLLVLLLVAEEVTWSVKHLCLQRLFLVWWRTCLRSILLALRQISEFTHRERHLVFR